MNNPMAEEYMQKAILFKQDWYSQYFGLKNPVIQNTFKQKNATSIAERV